MEIRQLYFKLNLKSLNYENIRDVFKKQQLLFKDSIRKEQRLIETDILFHGSKDAYIDCICSYIEKQLMSYLGMRNKVIEGKRIKEDIENPDQFNKKLFSIKEFRDKMQVTKQNIPNVLRDIFELFADIHGRRK